jgi:hypothetical protein
MDSRRGHADTTEVIALSAQVTVSLVVDQAPSAPARVPAGVPGLAFTGLPQTLAVMGVLLLVSGICLLLLARCIRKVRSLA